MLQKNYAKNVELILTLPSIPIPVTVNVALAPVGRQGSSKDGELNYACPDSAHTAPARVKQVYRCVDGHDHAEHELRRCRAIEDGGAVYVESDEVAAIRTGNAPKDVLHLRVHPADQVEKCTLPGSTAYRGRLMTPESENQRIAYATFLHLAANPDIALVGSLRLRDSRKVYRAIAHRGQLTIVSVALPEDLEPADEVTLPELTEKAVAGLDGLAEEMVGDFNSDEYRWDVAAAMAEMVAAKENEPAAAPVEVAEAAAESDLMAALEAMLASKQIATPPRTARKATPKKRTPRKVAAPIEEEVA